MATVTPLAYSTGVQVMHWTMGGSMIACVGLVLKAQDTKDKKEKGNLMFYHKSFGLLAGGLLGPRLLMTMVSKAPGHVVGANTLEVLGAKVSHLVMYGFTVGLPVSGIAMAAYGGYGMPFFYTTFPSLGKDPAIAKQAYETHKLMGSIFKYMIPLHVGGAFYHVFRGHSIFPRMINFLGKSAPKV